MRTQLFVAGAVLLVGSAAAQTSLPTIEVRAGGAESVSVPCAQPDSVTPDDVQRVLSIDDPSTTPALRKKFIGAVSAACKAGVPHILVKAGPNGSLTWKRVE